MSIPYTLHENNLTSHPNDFMAMVQPVRSVEMDQVIECMIRQGSTVVKADILSVLEDYYIAIESMLLEGVNINNLFPAKT